MTNSVILTGGPLRLMDDKDTSSEMPEALLIEHGRVRRAGSLVEARRTADTTPRIVDLDGRTVMPGFVDAHTHTILHGSGLDWVDLSDAKSVDDIVIRLQERARQHPQGPVRGYGYDQSTLEEKRHPCAADLDRVSSKRQVQIQHASGHGYAVNTAVLNAHGITAATPTPAGGRIDRDPSGKPTGVAFDSACDLLTGPDGVKVGNHGPNFHLPMPDGEVARLFDLGQQSLLEAGITTICDAQVTELEMAAYLHARDSGRLIMRAHLMYLSNKLDQLRRLGLVSRIGDERLELHGIKLYADGSVIARTAYLGGNACCGKPQPSGYLYHDPAELTELIVTAHELGLRTATHAQGEIPIGLVLDAIRQAQHLHPRRALRHRIEHCGFPTDEQIRAMAELDVVPVPQPMQIHLYADSLMEEFGDDGGRLYPYGAFHTNGVPIVLSSDAPVTMPAPLSAAWAAITRLTSSGATAQFDQAITKDVALRGITSTPAALLDRNDIGSLRVGSRADLVMLDADPVTASTEHLATTTVLETWVDGDVAWTKENV